MYDQAALTCSGESTGYLLFTGSANSTSPYSRSPSLGFTSSRRSILVLIRNLLLNPRRVGLRGFPGVPSRIAVERLEGACLVEMDHGVELVGQPSVEVVAQ